MIKSVEENNLGDNVGDASGDLDVVLFQCFDNLGRRALDACELVETQDSPQCAAAVCKPRDVF